MINILDENNPYLIIDPFDNRLTHIQNRILLEKITSYLYSFNYTLFPMSTHFKNEKTNSIFAISPEENSAIKDKCKFLFTHFSEKNIYIKYKDKNSVISMNKDLLEDNLNIELYPSNINEKVYVIHGLSFSFEKLKKYFFPKNKEHFKNDMVVEYFNNNRWISKRIENIDSEYDKMLKLLVKYEKVRINI